MKNGFALLLLPIIFFLFTGCILSSTPESEVVALSDEDTEVFQVSIFPEDGNTIVWYMDEEEVPGVTDSSFSYSPAINGSAEEISVRVSNDQFGVSSRSWRISLYQVPGNRSFLMGFTPWPFDFKPTAVEQTYEAIAAHADLICHHMDDGVPWPEAYTGSPYPSSVQAEINKRLANTRPGMKVYLALTPLSMNRLELAGYWNNEGSNMERPGEWALRNFDSPEVMAAYLNYCRYMIEQFNPDYVAYGIEANNFTSVSDPNYIRFKILVQNTYNTLKTEYPALPLFLTFQIAVPEADKATTLQINQELLVFSDYVASSTYPYWVFGSDENKANPNNLPDDWFDEMADLAPGKPYAVAENGYIAEDLSIPLYGVHIEATEGWQAEYVQSLFMKMNELNAEFIVWFCIRDYDQAWIDLKLFGFEPWGKMWRDTGLLDGHGGGRMALGVWDAWLALQRF